MDGRPRQLTHTPPPVTTAGVYPPEPSKAHVYNPPGYTYDGGITPRADKCFHGKPAEPSAGFGVQKSP